MFLDALAVTESRGSGDYQAVGNETHYGFAWGRYQIMGTNLSRWSKELLGYEVEPDEFLDKPHFQDVIAGERITKLLEVYEPVDVARIWFSGSINSDDALTDVNGKRVDAYVREVARTYENMLQ